jgi:hypothetical protein
VVSNVLDEHTALSSEGVGTQKTTGDILTPVGTTNMKMPRSWRKKRSDIVSGLVVGKVHWDRSCPTSHNFTNAPYSSIAVHEVCDRHNFQHLGPQLRFYL